MYCISVDCAPIIPVGISDDMQKKGLQDRVLGKANMFGRVTFTQILAQRIVTLFIQAFDARWFGEANAFCF